MKISYTKRGLILLALFFILTPDVFAAGLWEVLPTDKSMEYLGIALGGQVGAINLGGGANNPMLSKMFERFNFIIVSIGVTILSYIGIASAINTAREGEAMGKKFSLWVPLRAMFGMLLMVPSPGTGYSVVQMTVMWVVLNGIGAANQVWNVVLDQLAQGVRAVGKIDIDLNESSVAVLAEQVMRATACMQAINNIKDLPLTQKYGKVKLIPIFDRVVASPADNPTKISSRAVLRVGVEGAPNGDYSDLCGTFVLSTNIIKGDKMNAFNQNSLITRLEVKMNALLAVFAAVEPAVDQFSSPQTPGSTQPSPRGYVKAAINAYTSQITLLAMGINLIPREPETPGPTKAKGVGEQIGEGAASAGRAIGEGISSAAESGALGPAALGIHDAARSVIDTVPKLWEKPKNEPPTKEQITAFKRFGWIHAGSYYYAMSKTTNTGVDKDALSMPVPKTVPIKQSYEAISQPSSTNPSNGGWHQDLFTQLGTPTNRVQLNQIIGNVSAFAISDTEPTEGALQALGSGTPDTGNELLNLIVGGISEDMRKPIIKAFQQGMTGTDDPLVGLGKFGWGLMVAAEYSIFAGIIVALGASALASPAACVNPMAYAVNQFLFQVFIVIYTVIVLMWSVGATMGVYTPLIPYLIFTGTAVGWFIAVIEALVAAPIIALSMVQPGGEELGNLKTPMMILLNLFLRPTLMIFGFVIAGSLLRAILSMVNFGFERAVEESVLPTLFGIIPTIGIYAFFVISMVNQSFSLIYELPNKVMRYMGHSNDGFEPSKMTQKAEEGFQSAAGAGQKAVSSAGEIGQGYLKSKEEQNKASGGGGGHIGSAPRGGLAPGGGGGPGPGPGGGGPGSAPGGGGVGGKPTSTGSGAGSATPTPGSGAGSAAPTPGSSAGGAAPTPSGGAGAGPAKPPSGGG